MPVVLENSIFRIKFFPKGWGNGQNSHIAIGLERTCLKSLNSSEPTDYDVNLVLKHKLDVKKDY